MTKLGRLLQFGIKVTSVWRNERNGGIFYELWIVGEPTNEKYSSLAVVLLEHHFGVSLKPGEGKRVVMVVTKKLGGMVSAAELGRYNSAGMGSVPSCAHACITCPSSFSSSLEHCSKDEMVQDCVP